MREFVRIARAGFVRHDFIIATVRFRSSMADFKLTHYLVFRDYTSRSTSSSATLLTTALSTTLGNFAFSLP